MTADLIHPLAAVALAVAVLILVAMAVLCWMGDDFDHLGW